MTEQTLDTVVFDLGGVLIDWDPRHLYRKLFAGNEVAMEHFLATVCTHEWNRGQDAGRTPPQPSQQQEPPGFTDELNPRPDHGEHSYRGCGKLEGRAALINRRRFRDWAGGRDCLRAAQTC